MEYSRIKIGIMLALLFISAFLFGPILYWHFYSGSKDVIVLDDIGSYSDLFDNEHLAGKIVYVDIWGTKCGPCLQEFKFKDSILNSLENRSDVTFLYLATTYTTETSGLSYLKDKSRWKEYIKKYSLDGVHIYLDYPFFQDLWNELEGPENSGITGKKYFIPRYLILNREGLIIESSAYRPSNTDSLIIQLNSYL